MKMYMEKKRNLTYDYLRGLAMLLIVIGHLYFYSGRHIGSLIFCICDTVELPVFMYISGLLAHISVDRYGLRKLIASKVVRLLFPLISFYIIWGLWDSSNWSSFWMKEYKAGYWFMFVLFELMVTLSFIKNITLRFKVKSIYVTLFLYALSTLLMTVISKDSQVNRLLCLKLYWHFFPFFMMGYYSYKLEKYLILRYTPVYLLLYVIVFYLYLDRTRSIHMNMVCNLFSLLFLVSVFSTGFKPLKAVFATVGFYSLQIYMVHFFLLFPLLKILPIIESRWLEFPYYTIIASVIIFVTIEVSKLLMKSDWLALFLFGIRRK